VYVYIRICVLIAPFVLQPHLTAKYIYIYVDIYVYICIHILHTYIHVYMYAHIYICKVLQPHLMAKDVRAAAAIDANPTSLTPNS
jgi:hypothetical protein